MSLHPSHEEPGGERVSTGVAGVDEVIRAVEELEERPVEEHLGVYESAQARLRLALDAQDDLEDPDDLEDRDDRHDDEQHDQHDAP